MAGRIKTIRAPEAYPRAISYLKLIKTLADDNIVMNGTDRMVVQVSQLVNQLQKGKDNIDTISGVAGLDEYARSEWQENDPAYTFTDELVTIVAAVQAAGIEARNVVPVDGNGVLQEKKWQGGGGFQYNMITAANLVPLTALLQALSATID